MDEEVKDKPNAPSGPPKVGLEETKTENDA